MHTFLRILATLFLTAAILWGCTPLASTLTPATLTTAGIGQAVPTEPTVVNQTEVIEYAPAIPTAARPGNCAAYSQRIPRTNVWQCTVDDTTYDPCFTVGAEEVIVCTSNALDPAASFRVDLVAPLPVPPTVVSGQALDLEALKSLWYFGIDAVDEAVVLNNGEYRLTTTSDASGISASTEIVVRLSELKAEGDLDLDGDLDAATVLIATSSEIFARYYLVAILNENGTAVNSATTVLGDGIRVDNLAIEHGQIVVDMTTHGEQDPLCCPTVANTRYYNLSANQLERYNGAWQIQLDNDALCVMSASVDSTIGYQCSDGSALFASLQPDIVWTGQRPGLVGEGSQSTIDVETVAIKRVWR